VVLGLSNVIVAGIILSDGQMKMLPPMSLTLTGDEQLVLLGEDASALPNTFSQEAAGRSKALTLELDRSNTGRTAKVKGDVNGATEEEDETQIIVIVGWNESIGAVMDDIDRSVGKDSKVVVYSPASEELRVKFLDSAQKRRAHTYQNITVEHRAGSLGARFKLEELPLCHAHKVLLLADNSAESASEADSHTMATILQIQDILHDQELKAHANGEDDVVEEDAVVIIPQILQLQAEEACRMMGLQDLLNSTQLAAQIIALVSETPAMSGVIAEILSDTGVHFCIRDLSDYISGSEGNLPPEVSFDEIMVAAAKSGEVVFGWSEVGGSRSGPWEMNPKDKAKRRSCSADCCVVALRHVHQHLAAGH